MNYLNLFLLCIILSFNSGVNAAFQPQGVQPAEHVVITENGENKTQIKKQEANSNPNQTVIKERKMFKPSKVKGFSKLALWTTIGLILGLIIVVYFIVRLKKKLKEKPHEIHTKEVIREVQYVNDSMTPEELRHNQGELFQKYVIEMILAKKEYFDWIDSTRDLKYGELYPKSNMNPDLIIKFKYDKYHWEENLAVECKYRAGLKNNMVYIDEERKIINYKEFQKSQNIRTFLALGLGGSSSNPKNVFVIPIDEVKTQMDLNELAQYLNSKPYFYYDYNLKKLS